jgi:glycosyltransferase involved in cell wall biosynthesis
MLLIDATPLQSEHRLRGVGAYLRQLIGAIEKLDDPKPHYLISTVGRGHSDGTLPSERCHSVFRPHRPGQVYWTYNEVALRAALFKLRPAVFFAPDFNGLVQNPYGHSVPVLHDLTELKLSLTQTPAPKNLSLYLSDLRWRVYYQKLKRVPSIIAISHSAKQDACNLLGIPPERVHVIHHGVNHAVFRPGSGEGPYAMHPPYLLNIGARHTNKNQDRLLTAFASVAAEYPDVHLYFAGPWHAPDHNWLTQAAQQHGLDKRVRHIGYVPDAELPGLYGNALAFVFPSLEEGFGLPVLEAMACGTPVITSDCSSLPEVAGDAALLVDPRQVSAIAGALRHLLRDPTLQTELRTLGLSHAKQFTWERTAEETLSVLQQMTLRR